MPINKSPFAVKISSDLRKRVRHFCDDRGYKVGAFVERALAEKLEQEEDREDILDLKNLRHQEEKALPLEAYLKLRRRG